MEDFIQLDTNTKPNITYLAIGSAYSDLGGYQQHPPFLTDLMNMYSEFNFQIILLDPNLEDPPEAVSFFNLGKINDDASLFSDNNLQVYIIREKFSFQDIINGNTDSVSQKFLLGLINRTIEAKKDDLYKTYHLYVHDFSGNDIIKLSEHIDQIYYKTDWNTNYLFQKNVIIGLNHKIDSGCFPDINDIYFGPHRINNNDGSLEIFNPFLSSDEEIFTIIGQKCTPFKKLIIHAINQKINAFTKNIIPFYRQLRLALEKKNYSQDQLRHSMNSSSCLTSGVTNEEIKLAIESSISSVRLSLIIQINNNMFAYLESLISFLDYFPQTNIREEIFGPFINFCTQMSIMDHYQIINVFIMSQKKLETFLADI